MPFKHTCTTDVHLYYLYLANVKGESPPPPSPIPSRIWPISRGTPRPPRSYFQGLWGPQIICYPGPHYGSHRPCCALQGCWPPGVFSLTFIGNRSFDIQSCTVRCRLLKPIFGCVFICMSSRRLPSVSYNNLSELISL